MLVSRVLSRIPKAAVAQCRTSLLISTSKQKQRHFSILSNDFHHLRESPNKLVTWQDYLVNQSTPGTSAFQRCWMSSSAAPEPTEKETSQTGNENGTTVGSSGASANANGTEEKIGDAKAADQTKESDSEDELSVDDLSMDDLVKLVTEKEELLQKKHKEIEQMQDKVLRSYAEMENVMGRTKREADNSKKFAIQSFAKGLLDVADNLGRASSVVKDSFSKIDASKDTVGAVPLLKTLLEGVEMTEKQLAEVFKKFGVEKFDPLNENFDPHRHNAAFQIPDGSKPPGTVAVVLKSGYVLYDRVIRPAEVGVIQAVESNEAEQGSEA